MKKSLLALSAAAVALSGMAATPKQMQLQQPSALQVDRTKEIKPYGDLRLGTPSSRNMRKAPAKVSSADVIYNAEGTVQNMTSTASGMYIYYFWLMDYEDQQSASHIVYGDNNEVYFYDIVPNTGFGTYVKGIKDGDKIEISLPQVLYHYDDYGYGWALSMLDVEYGEDEDGNPTTNYVKSSDTSVTATVAEDGSISFDTLTEEHPLGLVYTDDDTWAYYTVSSLSYVPFNEKEVTPPAGYELSEKPWIVNTGEYGYIVNWVQGGEDVYFQGLGESMPDAWIKGTVEYEDDHAVISIAQDQYLGVWGGSYYIYTKCAQVTYDDEGELESAELVPEGTPYQLIWDFEEETLTPKDPNQILLLNAAKDRVYYLDWLDNLKLCMQDDFAGTPANPYGLSFEDYYVDYSYGLFYFNVPAISTEDTVLDTNDLYYVVYVDGEVWEFDADEYYIEETVEEVPWNLSVTYLYATSKVGRRVWFPVEGITTLGVQSVYKYDGEETRSEIVTMNLDDPTAVAPIAADKKVASVKYYGIDGREVANPAAGIFVKKVTFEDGTVATFKKAVR